MIGEWLFSSILFRDNPKHAQYPDVFKPVFESTAQEAGCSTGYLEEIAHTIAPQFLTELLTSYDWEQFKVVGFTSTFDQNVASLTLGQIDQGVVPRRSHRLWRGQLRRGDGHGTFPGVSLIDHVVVGEGEDVFPALVKNVLRAQEDTSPPGWPTAKTGRFISNPTRRSFPIFPKSGRRITTIILQWLESWRGRDRPGSNRILLYEGSRGCWWGEKHHCTFCGLNAQAMTFRAKSSEQVAQEMDGLSSRYNTTRSGWSITSSI